MTDTTKSYLCIPGFSVEVGDLAAGDGVGSITNEEGATSAKLEDYSTLLTDSSATEAAFTTSLSMSPNDSAYDGLVTVALLGVRFMDLEADDVVRATLTVGSDVYYSAAAVYVQNMTRVVGSDSEGVSVLGSGITDILFHDLPVSVLASGVEVSLELVHGDIASTSIRIGSVTPYIQVVLNTNPNTFTFSCEPVNNRYQSRNDTDHSSDGVLRRTVAFELHKLGLDTITGIDDDFFSSGATKPNLMRAFIAALGQRMLLSPYPYAVTTAWSNSPDTAELNRLRHSVRQNLWAFSGLLDRQSQLSVAEFRDGLNTDYKARLRFGEAR